MARAVGSLAAELLDLALPRVCAMCDAPSSPLCPACHGELLEGLFERPRRILPDPAPPHLPAVVVAGPFAGGLRRLVSAYKDDERRDLRPLLATLLAGSLEVAVKGWAPPPLVVPVPSSRAAVRRRGDEPVADLARSAARLASDRIGGAPVVVATALQAIRRVSDQSRLDHRQRAANLSGAYAVRPRWAEALAGSRVVLVDDVVTTGATLAEAARAVRMVGAEVVGAAALAATSRRRPGREC